MTKVNVDKAIDFVLASGDPILSALALFAAGRTNAEQALNAVKAYQRNDGGRWTTAAGQQITATSTAPSSRWTRCSC